MQVRCTRPGAILLLLIVPLLLSVAPVSAQEDAAGQVFRRINHARAEAGVPPLERNPLLEAAAQGHANDLAQNGSQLGHRGSDGSSIRQRIARAGYPTDSVGENWAGYRSLDKILDFWLNDPPHRKNILKPKYRDIGIGVAVRANGGLIIVTDFGGGGAASAQAPRESQNQPEVAPQVTAPTSAPPEPTAQPPPTQPPPPPPADPTAVPPPPPTASPTLVPTLVPVPIRVAIAKPVTTKPMRLRGKAQKLVVHGQAGAAYSIQPVRPETRRMLMGATMSIGGLVLFAIAMLGHRQYRMRR